MRKLICLFLMLILCLTGASAENARVAALKGPTAMGMVEMMENPAADYRFEICASADEITPRLVRGELDIAALPANLAAVLYNRTGGELRLLAINALGALYIAARDSEIQAVQDLRGRTIYSAGKGATPEFVLNYILEGSGLRPGRDVRIEYKSEHSECLAALLKDTNAAALLPEPFLTSARKKAGDVRAALDLNAEWDALQANGGALITGVLVGRKDFVEDNPEIVESFLAEYADSVAFATQNVADAAQLVDKYGIVPAEIAVSALPNCKIVLICGAEMREKLSGYLRMLYEAAPESVGGALPDAAFYYAAAE